MAAGSPLPPYEAARSSYFCPRCLKCVAMGLVKRRRHQEACRSGALDVSLLQCPTCGLVLAAELPAPR